VFVLDRPFPLSRMAGTLWAWHLTRQSTSGTLQEKIRGARGAIPGKVHDLLISMTRSLESLTKRTASVALVYNLVPMAFILDWWQGDNGNVVG